MTPLETEADPNIRVGPLRWGRPRSRQGSRILSMKKQAWIVFLKPSQV